MKLVIINNAFVVKELRAALRSRVFRLLLSLSTLAACLAVLLSALYATDLVHPFYAGRFIFQMVYNVALLVVCFVAPSMAAFTTSSEIRSGAVEAMVATNIKPWRIAVGTFWSHVVLLAIVLTAIWPVTIVVVPFGSVSLSDIIRGYLSILALLFPAVALGQYIGSRISMPRLATLIATFIVPACVTLVVGLDVFVFDFSRPNAVFELLLIGERLDILGVFGLGMILTEILCGYPLWLPQLIVPLWLLGSPTGLLLVQCVRRLRPMESERGTGWLKIWATASLLCFMVAAPSLIKGWRYEGLAGSAATIIAIGAGLLTIILILLLVGEPRQLHNPPGLQSRLTKAAALIGRGTVPTLRFTALASIVVVVSIPLILGWRLRTDFPGGALDESAAMTVIALGNCGVALFVAVAATWARTMVSKLWAARLIVLGGLLALSLTPLLILFAINGEYMVRLSQNIPTILRFSPAFPSMLGWTMTVQGTGRLPEEVLLTSAGYGLLGLFLWLLLELRHRRTRRSYQSSSIQGARRS